MSNLLDYQNIAMVGIKGVGMTALAQCLLDLKKNIVGFDVMQDFVTAPVLHRRQVQIFDLNTQLPDSCQAVVYSAAYDPELHPLLLSAKKKQLPIISLAQALAELFNQKDGIAVCGVGGKSSVSGWIMWLLNQLGQKVSGAVGVGGISDLNFTGRWHADGQLFVAEADEYAQNPMAVRRGEAMIPRFAGLEPIVIVCTNLKFDHPDVYHNFDHTKQVFGQFFHQLKPNGTLIYNRDDADLTQLAQTLQSDRPDIQLLGFGQSSQAQVQLIKYELKQNQPQVTVKINHRQLDQTVKYQLKVPGRFFVFNSLAVLAAGLGLGLKLDQFLPQLTGFSSVARRFEYRGEWQDVKLIDDYAHTPHELEQVIATLKQTTTGQVIVCFQPHTYSRTKAYLADFVTSLSLADQVILLPIFPSARERVDQTVSSDQIVDQLKAQSVPATLCQSFDQAVTTIKKLAHAGDSLATLGAGDVYLVIDILQGTNHVTA